MCVRACAASSNSERFFFYFRIAIVMYLQLNAIQSRRLANARLTWALARSHATHTNTISNIRVLHAIWPCDGATIIVFRVRVRTVLYVTFRWVLPRWPSFQAVILLLLFGCWPNLDGLWVRNVPPTVMMNVGARGRINSTVIWLFSITFSNAKTLFFGVSL